MVILRNNTGDKLKSAFENLPICHNIHWQPIKPKNHYTALRTKLLGMTQETLHEESSPNEVETGELNDDFIRKNFLQRNRNSVKVKLKEITILKTDDLTEETCQGQITGYKNDSSHSGLTV